MPFRILLIGVVFSVCLAGALADDVLHRFEGDVLPYDESAGWEAYDPCEEPCTELLQNGCFALSWPGLPQNGDMANYHYWIARPPDPPPLSLWVEWRFRSNHPLGAIFYSCDAGFSIHYGGMDDGVNLYGDATISFSGDHYVTGLDIDEFHTYRYESPDGVNYHFAVDGLVFKGGARDTPNGYHYLQFSGRGGCASDQIPDNLNEWDFVRFGTISSGEYIVVTDPPAGYLDPQQHAGLDRFTVTFDSANYLYIDDVTVQVTGGEAPAVAQTRRRENGEPDTVEIVLDGPIPAGELTRFIIDDGTAVNVVEYSFVTLTEGACCREDRSCVELTPEGCAAIPEAEYRGDDTHCEGDNNSTTGDDACEDPVPAVSEWGLALTTLLILATGTVLINRRSRADKVSQ